MSDPALLVYTNDFLQGTSMLEPEEMGVYVRLIFHQHQMGSLPNDMRELARLSNVDTQDFPAIWKKVSRKFVEREDGTLYNVRCATEIAKRSQSGRKKSCLAVFANWIKGKKGLKTKEKNEIKASFSIEPYLNIDDDESRKNQIINDLEGLLAKAIAKGSHIVNEDVNENINRDKEIKEEVKEKPIHQIKVLEKYPFEDWWELYSYKKNRDKAEKLWRKIGDAEKQKIMEHTPLYVQSTPDKQYRKHPATYLNNKSWNDEINESSTSKPHRISADTREESQQRYLRILKEKGYINPAHPEDGGQSYAGSG